MDRYEAELPEDLAEVAEQLRTRKHSAGSMELDELKRRTMAQATRNSRSRRQGKGLLLRSKIIAMSLVGALVLSGGAAGVIAGDSDNGARSAVKAEYHDELPEVQGGGAGSQGSGGSGGDSASGSGSDVVSGPAAGSGDKDLPFTGFELGIALLIGGGLLGAGLMVRRLASGRAA